MRIALSRASGSPKYENYLRWLRAGTDAHGVAPELVDLSAPGTDVDLVMSDVDALVLTGGEDIDPARYGAPESRELCHTIDVDRDGREWRALALAIERDLPVLGICRGLQVINVYFGGTLHPHLPLVLDGSEGHQKEGDRDRRHIITVVPGSLLSKGARAAEGEVNSAHHQAIDVPGEGLVASARADDGVIEAVEWSAQWDKPYLLAVQWHPERMEDQENPFAAAIRDQFLFEVGASILLSRVSRREPRDEEPAPEPEERPNDPFNLPIINPRLDLN